MPGFSFGCLKKSIINIYLGGTDSSAYGIHTQRSATTCTCENQQNMC